jgi:transcriptional regulator with XRE-family HTH domain
MLADIIRRYQSFNPDTGEFDKPRLLTEYAELLGVSYVYLSQLYNGTNGRKPGMETFAKLMRAFPSAQAVIGHQIANALAAPEREADEAVTA